MHGGVCVPECVGACVCVCVCVRVCMRVIVAGTPVRAIIPPPPCLLIIHD